MVSIWYSCLLSQHYVYYLQPFGVPPKLSSSLNIAKSIAAGMGAEVRDDVAASSPLAALTMTKETSKTGRACLFILVVCSKVKRKQKAHVTFGFRISKFGRV